MSNSFIESIHDTQVNITTREIFLHGFYADEDPGVDYRMANTFLKNIRILQHKSTKPIVVHQHTEGGHWDSGMVIFDSIASCRCPVILVMWGAASSMGSIIPQAADYRIISENCYMLIHDGSEDYSGTHKQIQEHLKHSKVIREKMLSIYGESCIDGEFFSGWEQNKIESFIKKQLNNKEDWILSAEEAVKYGFADKILTDKTIESVKKEYE